MGRAEGFAFETRADGSVRITHRGSVAAVLRGARARELLAALEAPGADPQLVMARWTGNYRHGNERTAKNHPRNR
ncbi:hypothetical protein [Streptomyces mayteni]